MLSVRGKNRLISLGTCLCVWVFLCVWIQMKIFHKRAYLIWTTVIILATCIYYDSKRVSVKHTGIYQQALTLSFLPMPVHRHFIHSFFFSGLDTLLDPKREVTPRLWLQGTRSPSRSVSDYRAMWEMAQGPWRTGTWVSLGLSGQAS